MLVSRLHKPYPGNKHRLSASASISLVMQIELCQAWAESRCDCDAGLSPNVIGLHSHFMTLRFGICFTRRPFAEYTAASVASACPSLFRGATFVSVLSVVVFASTVTSRTVPRRQTSELNGRPRSHGLAASLGGCLTRRTAAAARLLQSPHSHSSLFMVVASLNALSAFGCRQHDDIASLLVSMAD